MPEYLAPGVYIEETSFRARSIEGVSTTTTGFVGAARYGPLTLEPEIITGLGEFERMFGDRQQLRYGAATLNNYLWHAARAFFEEGGKRLYVTRVFKPLRPLVAGVTDPALAEYLRPSDDIAQDLLQLQAAGYDDGHARWWLPTPPPAPADPPLPADELARNQRALVRARFPGAAGNLRVRFSMRFGQNILGGSAANPTLGALQPFDVVWIGDALSPFDRSPPGTGALYLATRDPATQAWQFSVATSQPPALTLANLNPDAGDQVRVVTLAVTITLADGSTLVYDGLAPDPRHELNGASDALSDRFAPQPSNLSEARTLPIELLIGDTLNDGLEILQNLFGLANLRLSDPDVDHALAITLDGGNDGQRPGAAEYDGKADLTSTFKTGLKQFEDIEDISIIAAPGSTFGYENGYRADANAIVNLLISHATRMRYRIAVLDSGENQSIAQVRAMRARIDSTYAALYYPWVRVLDPVTRAEIYLPPSGFVAGIYARNDITRAVYKAPANEVVNLALGFQNMLNKAQQDVLNPEGINCFRFFEGRGFRLWGARTISSDPEWKYVNVRRYFIYLERSIDRGTQWAVFESNGEALWANVRRTIEDFLLNEWQSGALLGDKPEKAYFVRCDRSTMTQNDLDNGRLICLVGVAALKPAEFVIFRIGQWTADRKA
jgi:phage tail sheath protein FI